MLENERLLDAGRCSKQRSMQTGNAAEGLAAAAAGHDSRATVLLEVAGGGGCMDPGGRNVIRRCGGVSLGIREII